MSRQPIQLPPRDVELSRLVESFCDGTIAPEEYGRLESLLAGNHDAELFFVAYLNLHAEMQWLTRGWSGGSGEHGTDCPSVPQVSSTTDCQFVVRPPSSFRLPPPNDPSFPALPPLPSPSFPLFSFATLLSYAALVLVVGVALLIGAAWKPLDEGGAVSAPSSAARPVQPLFQPEGAPVARITGLSGCKWTDSTAAPNEGEEVPVGRKYSLAAGLMEISYDSGARVIVQGPAVYEAMSRDSGVLLRGRLTVQGPECSVPGSGAGVRRPGASGQAFVIQTPTATIADRGGEWGVDVEPLGVSRMHVFQGAVELQFGTDLEGVPQAIRLGETESARTVVQGLTKVATVVQDNALPGMFQRHLPGRRLGTRPAVPRRPVDLVARDRGFLLRPGVVASPIPEYPPPGATRLELVSTSYAERRGARARYTYQTTFEFPKVMPGTIVFRTWFLARSYLTAIRLNGKDVPVPKQGDDDGALQQFGVFVIRDGFVPGMNSLEFDVRDLNAGDSRNSPLALRSELSGMCLSVQGDLPPGWTPTQKRNETTQSVNGNQQSERK